MPPQRNPFSTAGAAWTLSGLSLLIVFGVNAFGDGVTCRVTGPSCPDPDIQLAVSYLGYPIACVLAAAALSIFRKLSASAPSPARSRPTSWRIGYTISMGLAALFLFLLGELLWAVFVLLHFL